MVFLLFYVREYREGGDGTPSVPKRSTKMQELQYPFDREYLLKKKKSLRKVLLAKECQRLHKKVAVLGGSTTHDIVKLLELFLLDMGIEPEFYQSEYNRYYEDAVFGNEELDRFGPDIVYIHTTSRNVADNEFPQISDTREQAEEKTEACFRHFTQAWEALEQRYGCTVIQNNFEKPSCRLLGNMDAWDYRGREWFLGRLNQRFYEYAQRHENFLIQDIDWLAAEYGLSKWNDPLYWHMYKYSPAPGAIPELAFNLANIIKAIYGKNKKALVLDLDNTLWGGVVGDDGPENIEIGQETGAGQIYSEFQTYLKAHKDRGILLNINSKNEEDNALAGLSRPDSVLKPEDFIVIKANWEPKDENLRRIAEELNIGEDSLVFVDDNPAERHRVQLGAPAAAVLGITEGQEPQPERYIKVLDRSGFFEPVRLSGDDLNRSGMYRANTMRKKLESTFEDYRQYLLSLDMKAEIESFAPEYMQRIAQLTNKSNQFNLTTLRCSQSEIENFRADSQYLTLYGRLRDRFGDNGVVSVVLGLQEGQRLHLKLWLMSCRVLKRDMEKAMLDQVVKRAASRGVKTLTGYYYPTAKNRMVKEFYGRMGFTLIEEKEDGSSIWEMDTDSYKPKNTVIQITGY